MIRWIRNRMNCNVNWRYNKKSILGYIAKTVIIFFLIIVFCWKAGFYGRMLLGLLAGTVLFIRGKRGGGEFWLSVIPALIVALLLIFFVESLMFASLMVIVLGLPTYVIESLLDTYHIQEDRVEQHPLNPYPKWVIFFGIFWILVNLVTLAGGFNEIPESIQGAQQVEISELESGDKVAGIQEKIEELKGASANVKQVEIESGILGKGREAVSGARHFLWEHIWEYMWNAWSWFVFCIILTVYATPSEVKDLLGNYVGGGSGSGGAQGVGFASLLYMLRDLFLWLKSLLGRRT